MKTFIPAENVISGASGDVIASGCGKFEDAGSRITLAERGVGEMDRSASAGYVQQIELGPAGLFVRAVIIDPIAVKKLRERVYCGFAVVSTAGADGVPVVERVCLVDAPAALGKRSAVKSRDLYLNKDVEMPKPPTLDEAEADLMAALAKVRSQRHNQRGGDEATLAAIRKAHAKPFREAAGVTALLTKRSRIN
jgi:hypothetical protein